MIFSHAVNPRLKSYSLSITIRQRRQGKNERLRRIVIHSNPGGISCPLCSYIPAKHPNSSTRWGFANCKIPPDKAAVFPQISHPFRAAPSAPKTAYHPGRFVPPTIKPPAWPAVCTGPLRTFYQPGLSAHQNILAHMSRPAAIKIAAGQFS